MNKDDDWIFAWMTDPVAPIINNEHNFTVEDKMNVVTVELDKIEFWEKKGVESQVRSSGIDSKHVDDLIASISSAGLKEPVTLEKIFGKEKYRCVDGNHRCAAVKEINKKNGTTPEIDAVIRSYSSSAQRLESQIAANHHDPALKNTFADIRRAFINLVKVEGRCGDLSALDTDKEKIQQIKDYVDSMLPGYKDSKKVANAVWNSMPQDIKKIKGYTKTQAIEEFNQKNLVGCGEVSRSGEYSNGTIPYFCSDVGFFNTTVGQAIKKHIKYKADHSVEVVLVSWLGVSTGKEPNDVRAWRKNILADAAAINTWSGKKVFSKVLFLPQILEDGNKRVDNHLIIEKKL